MIYKLDSLLWIFLVQKTSSIAMCLKLCRWKITNFIPLLTFGPCQKLYVSFTLTIITLRASTPLYKCQVGNSLLLSSNLLISNDVIIYSIFRIINFSGIFPAVEKIIMYNNSLDYLDMDRIFQLFPNLNILSVAKNKIKAIKEFQNSTCNRTTWTLVSIIKPNAKFQNRKAIFEILTEHIIYG